MANPIPLVANDAEGAPKGAIPIDLYGVESGGGAVESVNGQTGAVNLTGEDIPVIPGGGTLVDILDDLIFRVGALESVSEGPGPE